MEILRNLWKCGKRQKEVEMNFRNDYHIHSCYSPEEACRPNTLERIVKRVVDVGLVSFGISDHLHGKINMPFLVKAREEFDRTKVPEGFQFFFGLEVSCLREWDMQENERTPSIYVVHKGGPEDSPLTVYLNKEVLEKLHPDYVIGGAHWPLGAPLERESIIASYHRQNMFLAEHPGIDIIAHPWWWMGDWKDSSGRYSTLPWFDDFSVIPERMHEEFGKSVIKNNKAVEINAGAIFLNKGYPESFKKDYVTYLKKLQSYGVRFSLGSDAHKLCDIGNTLKLEEMLSQ